MQISFTRSKLTMLLFVLAAIAAYLAPSLRAEQLAHPPIQALTTDDELLRQPPLDLQVTR